MPLPTGLAAAALLGLLTLLATARRGRRRHRSQSEHPESLTAVLGPGDEEYLAWLADHHWPGDEYLDLEHEWLTELEFGEPAGHYESPMCPQCNLRREDVWPCPTCGRLLHSSCGHGMRRRTVDRPYRTHATNSEAVIAEWICTGCTSVVGLDVDHGGEPDEGLLR
ncbi:hypothetical protein [Actinomadura darangshiensis]|uniref:hypothetical protein n=1 Tax=Actinomadura darangshiensis TaxID=705336 RepID=UPI001A9E1EDB|nr:hypothetical protein [Actinomadura darangshiensis]